METVVFAVLAARSTFIALAWPPPACTDKMADVLIRPAHILFAVGAWLFVACG